MDVTTYIKRNKPELKMPKPDPVTGRDKLGIRFQGPVMTGRLGVKEQLERQAVSLPQASAQIREIAPGGVHYLHPTTHLEPSNDPRLERDPVYANQRSQLPHPSFADPVIRHHLNLPPLSDPYEKHRR